MIERTNAIESAIRSIETACGVAAYVYHSTGASKFANSDTIRVVQDAAVMVTDACMNAVDKLKGAK